MKAESASWPDGWLPSSSVFDPKKCSEILVSLRDWVTELFLMQSWILSGVMIFMGSRVDGCKVALLLTAKRA